MAVLAEPGGELEAGGNHLGQGRSSSETTCGTAAHGTYVLRVTDEAALPSWRLRAALGSLTQVRKNSSLFAREITSPLDSIYILPATRQLSSGYY